MVKLPVHKPPSLNKLHFPDRVFSPAPVVSIVSGVKCKMGPAMLVVLCASFFKAILIGPKNHAALF